MIAGERWSIETERVFQTVGRSSYYGTRWSGGKGVLCACGLSTAWRGAVNVNCRFSLLKAAMFGNVASSFEEGYRPEYIPAVRCEDTAGWFGRALA